MAITNIFREPWREIVETIVGVLAVVPFFYGTYWLTGWVNWGPYPPPYALRFVIMGLCLFVGCFLSFLVLFIVHEIGDNVCNALDRRGLRLRPRDRYL